MTGGRVLVLAERVGDLARLTDALRREGLTAVAPRKSHSVLTEITELGVSCVLVHTGLGQDAFGLCRDIRRKCTVPIVVISPVPDELEELMAFANGADEFLHLNGSLRVNVARVASLVRRSRRSEAGDPDVLLVGGLRLDLAMRTADLCGAAVPLTRTEFELLRVLAVNHRRVVPRRELLLEVWGPWTGDGHVLETHLSRLRGKLLAAGGSRLVHSVPGVGYHLGHVPEAAPPTEVWADWADEALGI